MFHLELLMLDKNRKHLVSRIIGEMDKVLSEFCFFRYDKTTWLRKWGWKTDMIDLYDRIIDIMINFQVIITPAKEPDSLDFNTVGFVNLFSLVGFSEATINYPTFSFSSDSFIEEVKDSLLKGLPWFSNFDKPSMCWDYMKKDEWNIEFPHSKECRRYLQSLPSETENICSLLKCPADLPTKYSLALFDVNYRGRLPKVPCDKDAIL